MTYAEQANLLSKVKSVCASVTTPRQLDVLRKYCQNATNQMSDSDLISECHAEAMRVETTLFPHRTPFINRGLAGIHNSGLGRNLNPQGFGSFSNPFFR